MPSSSPKPELCNCLAIRQAARHVSQLYDQCLAPTGLRGTQFSILSRLNRLGPQTINALAHDLVMDRTTLGRNILPLEREGLIEIRPGRTDRRSKELRLTEAGTARLRGAMTRWVEAQARFEAAFGEARASALRDLMHAVAMTEFATSREEGAAAALQRDQGGQGG
jgi:DNA-binding MarR family transcriptional regulator